MVFLLQVDTTPADVRPGRHVVGEHHRLQSGAPPSQICPRIRQRVLTEKRPPESPALS